MREISDSLKITTFHYNFNLGRNKFKNNNMAR